MPRKRARDLDVHEVPGRQPSPPRKMPKPTVAANAQAIANLSEKMSGVDDQLTTMNNLLAQLASAKTTPQVTQVQTPNTAQAAAHPAACPNNPQPASAPVVDLTAMSGPLALLANYHNTPGPLAVNSMPVGAQQQYTTGLQYARPPTYPQQLPGDSTRARHHTTGPECPSQTTGPPAGHTAGTPAFTTWPTAVNTGYHQPPATAPVTAALFTNPPAPTAVNPWDHPTTLQDLEADSHLTRRVAEALHAVATPFAGQGKNAQFPHLLVTRGPKRQKTNLGELSLPEYIWGFIQMIKSKEQGNPDVRFMMNHLENITEDARRYEWKGIRAWSEEILSQISQGNMRWSDSYRIDRLQSEMSRDRSNSAAQTASAGTGRKGGYTYDMSEEVKAAKPGPPCRFYQTDSCSSNTHHVQN